VTLIKSSWKGHDVYSFMERHGLTNEELAAKLGVTDRTIRNYLNDHVLIPLYVELAMYWLEHQLIDIGKPIDHGADATPARNHFVRTGT